MKLTQGTKLFMAPFLVVALSFNMAGASAADSAGTEQTTLQKIQGLRESNAEIEKSMASIQDQLVDLQKNDGYTPSSSFLIKHSFVLAISASLASAAGGFVSYNLKQKSAAGLSEAKTITAQELSHFNARLMTAMAEVNTINDQTTIRQFYKIINDINWQIVIRNGQNTETAPYFKASLEGLDLLVYNYSKIVKTLTFGSEYGTHNPRYLESILDRTVAQELEPVLRARIPQVMALVKMQSVEYSRGIARDVQRLVETSERLGTVGKLVAAAATAVGAFAGWELYNSLKYDRADENSKNATQLEADLTAKMSQYTANNNALILESTKLQQN